MSFPVQNDASEFPFQGQVRKSSGVLGKDDFLRLLVMQLRYQDPMNPLKGTEFAAQLAQFSSVEQLSNINTSLAESLQNNARLAQSIHNALSATLIGNEVRVTMDSFAYDGTTPVMFGYSLSESTASVVIHIRDGAGHVVKTFHHTDAHTGDTFITWDGTDDHGKPMKRGVYSFTVEAKDAQGGTLSASKFVVGVVQGIRFKPGGSMLLLDGIEVPFGKILEIGRGQR